MSFLVDPTVPTPEEPESLGPSRIQALAAAILQLFGLSPSSSFTFPQSPFSLDPAGLPEVPSNPVDPLGIATKQYVDAAVVGSTLPRGPLLGGPTAYTALLNPVPASLAALTNVLIEAQANVACAAG